MSNMHRHPRVGEPTLPSVWTHQRHLFNEHFVATVMGQAWPNPDLAQMPPSRRVFDGLGGSVVAWEAECMVAWIIENRPDRIPHLYAALRRHFMKLAMIVADLEQEFDAKPFQWVGGK